MSVNVPEDPRQPASPPSPDPPATPPAGRDPTPRHTVSQFPAEARDALGRGLERMTGDIGAPSITFGQLFSEVFSRHTAHDAESLLLSGTYARSIGTPPGRKPWLFSRLWLVLAVAFALMLACCALFPHTSDNVVPGMIFFGAMTMPVAIMVFFWEINDPRNINLFQIIRVFFIGGAISILLTFLLDAVLSSARNVSALVGWSLASAALTSVTEEIAKVVAVYFFVRRLPYPWIMNGLLVGAVVGCGFAGFETMGYALQGSGDLRAMVGILINRGVLAVGGHAIWTPIAGAALMRAIQTRRGRGLTGQDYRAFASGRFWALFAVPLVLHLVWDFFCAVLTTPIVRWFALVGLCVVGWVFVVRLINSGLKEFRIAQTSNGFGSPAP